VTPATLFALGNAPDTCVFKSAASLRQTSAGLASLRELRKELLDSRRQLRNGSNRGSTTLPSPVGAPKDRSRASPSVAYFSCPFSSPLQPARRTSRRGPAALSDVVVSPEESECDSFPVPAVRESVRGGQREISQGHGLPPLRGTMRDFSGSGPTSQGRGGRGRDPAGGPGPGRAGWVVLGDEPPAASCRGPDGLRCRWRRAAAPLALTRRRDQGPLVVVHGSGSLLRRDPPGHSARAGDRLPGLPEMVGADDDRDRDPRPGGLRPGRCPLCEIALSHDLSVRRLRTPVDARPSGRVSAAHPRVAEAAQVIVLTPCFPRLAWPNGTLCSGIDVRRTTG
jgi:hypothetical protein